MEKIFAKPGRDWNEEEQALCIEWLLEEEQLSRILKFVSSRRGSNLYDARDAWSSFYPNIEKHVIRKYDPARGTTFWNFLLFCLGRHCLRAVKSALRTRSREDLVGDYDAVSLDLVDQRTAANPEEMFVIKDLVEKGINELYRKNHLLADVLVAIDLEQKAQADLAMELGLNESTLRVRLFRARRELKSILDRLQRITERH